MMKVYSVEVLVESIETLSNRAKEIAVATVRQFLADHKKYFRSKRIGDIGCGDAKAQDILANPNYECEYEGIDISGKPDIYWDYRRGPRDTSMMFDVVLWFQPSSMDDIRYVTQFVKTEGLLAFQCGAFMFSKWKARKVFAEHAKIIDASEYITHVVQKDGETLLTIDDVFLVGKKSR